MPLTSRPTTRIVALAAVALWLTACGGGPTTGGPAGPSDSQGSTGTTDVLAITTTSTATTAPPSTSTLVPDECQQDRHTLEVAVEAFFAGEGRVPDAERELVDTGMLLAESGSYDLVDGEIVRVVGAPCDYEPIQTANPLTADRVFGSWPDSLVERYGGPDCALEQAAVMAAGQNFINRENRVPETLADLDGDLDRPVVLWQWSENRLIPVEGSGCSDLDQADPTRACQAEKRTLEVAREAYLAQNGAATEPTEDDLVTAGYLRTASEPLALLDGVITAVPGGDCEGTELDPEPTRPDDCESDRRTLEVAAEAYRAQLGEWPVDETDLVTTGMLRTVSSGHDLGTDGVVIPAPGGGCE